jgi:glycerophosphoryl diester phosphodiesterase
MAKEINYSKRKSVWSVVLTLFCIVLCLAIVLIAFPLSTYIPRVGINGTDFESEIVKQNKYINKDINVIAHRGGSLEVPENTLLAFKNALSTYGFNAGIEIDVRLTKDGYLVVSHDATLDRVSNCAQLGYMKCTIAEYNYNELKRFNLGYNFQDAVSGEYTYRNVDDATLSDLRLCTLNEVLSAAKEYAEYNGRSIKDLTFYIDIKDGGARGMKAANKVYNAMKAYGIIGNTVVECFTDSVARYIDDYINTPDVRPSQRITRAASTFEIWQFYFNCMFNLDLTKTNFKYKVLSMPYSSMGIDFAKGTIIDYAHKYGLAVNYWTVNDKVRLAYVETIGADGVITDNVSPALRMMK